MDSSFGAEKHKHYQSASNGFLIHHYAGQVVYEVDGFCDRNRDVLFTDLITLMQSSDNPFVRNLFPDSVTSGAKSRPTTAGSKIKTQGNQLVESLMRCTPHYIRCIKPNETKKPLDWENDRVKHQVEYLGLQENIRVRRAGFAYRRAFEKFLQRYAILTKETWPKWKGDPRSGIKHIMASVQLDPDQFQMGKSKVFVKNPESLFLLEEVRERKFDFYARIIQKAFRRYNAAKHYMRLKQEASDLLFQKKERRRHSLNRNFVGDYIGLDFQPGLRALLPRRERVDFAATVEKYDRRFKVTRRDLIVTTKGLYIVGREKVKKGPDKGRMIEVIKRKIDLETIAYVGLSPLQDDFVVIFVSNDYASLIQTVLKTEFLTTLSKRYKDKCGRDLRLYFNDSLEYTVNKEKNVLGRGGGGSRTIKFIRGQGDDAQLKPSGKNLIVTIGPGLPKDSKPGLRSQTPDILKQAGRPGGGRGAPGGGVGGAHRPAPSRPAPMVTPDQIARRLSNDTGHSPALPSHGARHPPIKQPMRQIPPPEAQNYMQTPDPGQAGQARKSLQKPQPGGGRPKPPPKPKPAMPKCKTLFAYDAADTDELCFNAGDIVEVLKEDDSGWWLGRLRGKEGLFPSNYVQKI